MVYDYFILPCFADDTGLEVESLGGEPGVFSARYAGEEKNAQKNMDLLLNKLEGINNRRARFRTVITYKTKAGIHQFEGIVEGEIIDRKIGDYGFGYDEDYKQFRCKCGSKNCCGYIVRDDQRWRINRKFAKTKKARTKRV